MIRLTYAIIFALVFAGVGVSGQTATAECRDGTLSYSQSHSGTCSGHKGVAKWLTTATATALSNGGPPTGQPQQRTLVTTDLVRDVNGRIARSAAARHAFERQTGFPNGRPGWVIDHIVPLACGGADAPSNMQWQTVEAAKAKDKFERKGC